jgi:hypothetical protein
MMKWLRRDQDCIGLVLAWALLVQSLLLAVSSGAYAATLATGGSTVLCTQRGAVTDRTVPGQRHKSTDCQCCSVSCRTACGGGGGSGLLPIALRVPLPAAVEVPAEPPRAPELTLRSAETSLAQPRAPPLA